MSPQSRAGAHCRIGNCEIYGEKELKKERSPNHRDRRVGEREKRSDEAHPWQTQPRPHGDAQPGRVPQRASLTESSVLARIKSPHGGGSSRQDPQLGKAAAHGWRS